MAGYALSPAAQADLEEIWEYTARHWGEAQAERYTRDIQAACEAMSDGTLVGQSAEDFRAGYRKDRRSARMSSMSESDRARSILYASCTGAWTLRGTSSRRSPGAGAWPRR